MDKERYNNEDFLYASAYVRCREKYLLNREGVEKMVDSKTPEDALKILYEFDYGVDSEETDNGFEALLSGELEKTYKMILSLTSAESYFAVFLFPNDYQNIKTLLKAEFLGITADELLIDAGSIPAAQLKDLIQNRGYSAMRPEMSKGIQEAIESYGRSRDPQTIDLILDQACYRDMNADTAKLKNDFIKGYLALKIDTTNLKSFVRSQEMKKPWRFFSGIFLEGGGIGKGVFTENYELALEQFAEKLWKYGLQKTLQEGAAMIKETGRVTALEKSCDNLLMEYIRGARYICAGPEVLFAFMAAKEGEIKNARIIMAGKHAGLPPDQIRERVRKTYA